MSKGDESLFKFEFANDRGITIGANLSKREWLAGLAMQGLATQAAMIEAYVKKGKGPEELAKPLAILSVRYADALLAELEKIDEGKR